MKSATDTERLVAIEAGMTAHVKADELGFARINQDTSEIKETLRSMATDLKGAVERIHTRIDDEASKARDGISNAVMAARADTKGVADETASAHKRIDGQKIWLLSTMVAGLFVIVGWFADLYLRGGAPH